MTALQVHIGIDVSKDAIDLHALPAGQSLRLDIRPGDFEPLHRFLAALEGDIELIVLEATGGYEASVVASLVDAGLPVVVANPRQVRRFAEAMGQLAKTDRIDAHVIALFAQRMRPRLRPLADADGRELRAVIARRGQIMTGIAAEKTRLAMTNSALVRASIERSLSSLRDEIAVLDQHLARLVEANEAWSERERLLQTVPSVGPVVSRTLLACLPELGQASRREIAALAGLAPMAHDSGQKHGQRRISGGRAAVRSALYMATISGVRYNSRLRTMYDRLVAAGKTKKQALIACARKLLIILNAIVRTQTPWQPEPQKH